ncbi:MAG: polysaccharide pyruvyl transferase family protein [Clostridia bacterium]|nr:polysaccharide pyruvyl transferase family protein [Clostridia bacterium]
MLRVCGVTYTFTTNYGSCLQAYALQHMIGQMTIQGERCMHELLPTSRLQGYLDFEPAVSVKRKVKKLIAKWHRCQFAPFEKAHMHFAQCETFEELQSLNDRFDAFVCGSDVIWSPDFNHGYDLFYLDFARKYAFSYAASFGKSDIPVSMYPEIQKKLANLDSISVREEHGAKLVKECSDRTAQVVSDPVLLLDRTAWNEVAAPQKKARKPYIFVYVTHWCKNMEQFIELLKAETGLPVVMSAYSVGVCLKRKVFLPQSPDRWLQQLRDAEYVVTNSFHATAFSNIFHKKFFVVVNGERDKGINIRMYNLLNKLGLLDRLFAAPPEKIDTAEIDFTQADKEIAAMREESLTFLRENLEAAYAEKIKLVNKES